MLLVNKHGIVHDTTDVLGDELLAAEQGFRHATPAEEKEYAIQVAKSSPRYLARMNARRDELDKKRNQEIDRLIDEEIAKEEGVIASEAGQTLEERGGSKAENLTQEPGPEPTVNPDELELDDSEIKPLTTEADVQTTSERRRRRE